MLFAYLAGSDVGHRVRLNGFGLTSNADGSVGFGGIVFDDTDGSLTVRGWMKVVVKETACTAAPVLFSGYIGPRRYSRDGDSQYRTAAARWIDTDLVDENAVLHIRLITGADGKRPAETHNARIDWLVDSAYLSGLIDDVTLVDTSNPRPFEEADYRGQYADDVLNDLAGPIFRTFFVYPTQPTGGRGLFFDTPTATVGTSTLRISNVLGDVDTSTTFAPFIDATLTKDPSEVYSRIRYTYAHGTVIEDDAGTVTEFFTDNGLGARGLQVNNTRIGLESSARSMAENMLSRDDDENNTIAVTVRLPAAKVGLIGPGERIEVRFSHLPDYESFTFTRVTSRTIMQAPGNPDWYDVRLELNSHGVGGGGGGGAPGPGTFPHPPSSGAGIVQQVSGLGNLTMPSAITEGNTLIYVGAIRAANFSAWDYVADGYVLAAAFGESTDPGGTNAAMVIYKTAASGEGVILNPIAGSDPPGADAGGTWYELAGEWAPDEEDENTGDSLSVAAGPITAAANSITFAIVGQGQGGSYDSASNQAMFDGGYYTLASGWIEDFDSNATSGHPTILTAHQATSGALSLSAVNAIDSASGYFIGAGDLNYIAQMVSFAQTDSTGSSPPEPGQRFGPITPVETPDGATYTFTLPDPYTFADLSLEVFVNRLDQTAAVTSYDGATRQFTLAFAPWGTDVIEVYGQGR